MVTRLYSDSIFLEHITPTGHPERPGRLKAITEALSGEAFSSLTRCEAVEADVELLKLVHPENYVSGIRDAVPASGIVHLDADTVTSPQSWRAALCAVGSACAAVDDVFSGAASNVFVASRPPGHHAETATAMGFCLFNNAAIAARYAQKTYDAERIAIIDWDVHHGNGTQEIFWEDKDVLYASTHQMPLFPGTGAKNEAGQGNIVNAPLAALDGSEVFREAFETRILPALDAFCPNLIVISAGFDAHHRDPLGQVNLSEADFDWASGHLMDMADKFCAGRIVSLLEGGYDLTGLSQSVAAHVSRLMKG